MARGLTAITQNTCIKKKRQEYRARHCVVPRQDEEVTRGLPSPESHRSFFRPLTVSDRVETDCWPAFVFGCASECRVHPACDAYVVD